MPWDAKPSYCWLRLPLDFFLFYWQIPLKRVHSAQPLPVPSFQGDL